MAHSSLQITLLGDFGLTYLDQPVTGVNSARLQSLLAYLVLHRQAPQLRQRLAFYLWPDSTDTQARTNLRKELSYLRRTLPEADTFLLADAKTLQWQPNAPFTLDVAEFEAAVQTAAESNRVAVRSMLETAAALYRGDLLPNCDDEWVLPERERLQQMRNRVFEQLIALLEDHQDYRTALGYAQQLLQTDPLNEATYCTLMRLHNLSGDRANALQVYHRCMTTLREELGIDPSASTRTLYEQLLVADEATDPPAPARSRSSPPVMQFPLPSKSALLPLVGREREWVCIQQWASSILPDDAIATTAAAEVLLLVGEPGIGKTRLLEELRTMMQARQGQVLWGRGFAAEMVRPYGIWIDALRSIGRSATVPMPTELGFLLPEMGQPTKAPPDRTHLFDAVVQLLAQYASQAPLVVILDDLQWIDEASSALLHYAIRLLSHLPVLFACTGRSRELEDNATISRVLQALRREQRLRTLELQPLDREQTAELICRVKTGNVSVINASDCFSDRASDWPMDVVDRVFIDSGGNPLFVLEVARALSQDQAAHADNLEALIHDRLQQLDEAARDILPWAAALGRSFKPATVAHVADYPLTKLLMAIEQLERQTIIRPSTSPSGEMGYDFAHDIVRQVVYRQLSEPRRHLVHLQIAHRLNQLTTSDNGLAGEVAHHASLGGDHVLAVSTALSAAERCLKLFAYVEASKLAQRGIQHCQRLDEQTRISMQLRLLRVWATAGVTGDRVSHLDNEVHRLINEAHALGLKDDEAIGLETLMVLHFDQCDFTSVHQHSLRAAEASRLASPVTAARLLAHSGSCLAEIGREMMRAEALLLEAQSLAARVGLEIIDIPSGLGCVHRHNGNYAEARMLLQQVWQLSQGEQDHWREWNTLSCLVMTELEAGDPGAALPYCHEMAVVAARIKGEGSEGAVAAALAALASYRLQQPGADTVLEQAIAALKQVDAKRMLAYVLIGAAEVDLQTQRPELATLRAEAALQAAQIINHPSEIALAWAIAMQGALALGDRNRAAQFEALHYHIDRHTLSARARTAVDQVTSQLQPVNTVPSGHSTRTLN